jgi:hypothetical protein
VDAELFEFARVEQPIAIIAASPPSWLNAMTEFATEPPLTSLGSCV